MGYNAMKKLEGFEQMGGEVPYLNPDKLVIVGLDVPETPENWFAHCARLKDISDDDLRDYAESMIAAGKVDHVVKAFRDGDTLVPLDGRSTTRAARLARTIQAERKVPVAERITVRVNIVRGDPEELYRVNLDSHKHRPLTRTQVCKGVLTYHQRVGEDLAKTIAFFKMSAPTIKAMLAHFDLSEAAQRAIDRKELPATATKKLAKLPRAKQDETVNKMKKDGTTKGASAEAALDEATGGKQARPVPKTTRRTIAEHLANGQVNHLHGEDLKIARALAAYERFISGDRTALDYLAPIKAVVESAIATPKKATASEA